MTRSWVLLVAGVCAAQVLTMLGFSAFAALLPWYRETWQMTNTEAGWIGAGFFAGYVLAVPLLVSLTDRIDPRLIYAVSALLTAAANLAFAWAADGVVSAALLRALAGAGLAGTYMPGLKGLCDHIAPHRHSRVTAVYTSSFLLGSALSYPLARVTFDAIGPGAPFAVGGIAAALAAVLVPVLLPKRRPAPAGNVIRHLLDFRPVFRNPSVMAFTLCYALHSWELFAFHAWVVAFLVFAEGLHGSVPVAFAPTVVAAILTVLGMPAMIVANELAIRFGRARTVSVIMGLSALVAVAMGATPMISYGFAAIACIVYGFTTIAESAVVTAGAFGSADPDARGAALAVHSTLGFAGASIGPLAFGIMLDLGGGDGILAWIVAFGHLGLVMALGPVVVAVLKPRPLSGDRVGKLRGDVR
jgi:MFS family permease